MKAYLAAGLPIVWGFGATTDFEAPSADGFVPFHKDAAGIGGHAVHIVAAIDNAELAQLVPQAPPGDGGGYFIIKNSWGECYADRGYVYLPFDFVSTTSWGAVVVTGATQ